MCLKHELRLPHDVLVAMFICKNYVKNNLDPNPFCVYFQNNKQTLVVASVKILNSISVFQW